MNLNVIFVIITLQFIFTFGIGVFEWPLRHIDCKRLEKVKSTKIFRDSYVIQEDLIEFSAIDLSCLRTASNGIQSKLKYSLDEDFTNIKSRVYLAFVNIDYDLVAEEFKKLTIDEEKNLISHKIGDSIWYEHTHQMLRRHNQNKEDIILEFLDNSQMANLFGKNIFLKYANEPWNCQLGKEISARMKMRQISTISDARYVFAVAVLNNEADLSANIPVNYRKDILSDDGILDITKIVVQCAHNPTFFRHLQQYVNAVKRRDSIGYVSHPFGLDKENGYDYLLKVALELNNIKFIKMILENKFYMNAPIHLAIEYDNIEALGLMLQYKIGNLDESKILVLKKKNVDMMRMLLERDTSIHFIDVWLKQWNKEPSQSDMQETIDFIFKILIDVDVDVAHSQLLFMAVDNGAIDVVRRLIFHNPSTDVNIISKEKSFKFLTPLALESYHDDVKMINVLLDHTLPKRANINANNGLALKTACRELQVQAVKALLNEENDPPANVNIMLESRYDSHVSLLEFMFDRSKMDIFFSEQDKFDKSLHIIALLLDRGAFYHQDAIFKKIHYQLNAEGSDLICVKKMLKLFVMHTRELTYSKDKLLEDAHRLHDESIINYLLGKGPKVMLQFDERDEEESLQSNEVINQHHSETRENEANLDEEQEEEEEEAQESANTTPSGRMKNYFSSLWDQYHPRSTSR